MSYENTAASTLDKLSNFIILVVFEQLGVGQPYLLAEGLKVLNPILNLREDNKRLVILVLFHESLYLSLLRLLLSASLVGDKELSRARLFVLK